RRGRLTTRRPLSRGGLMSPAMPLIEIRRHAERADPKNNQGSLSEAGRAMALALAKRAPRFALVLSSPLPRAKETAQLIAGRLDRGAFGYGEGVLVTYASGVPVKIGPLRV